MEPWVLKDGKIIGEFEQLDRRGPLEGARYFAGDEGAAVEYQFAAGALAQFQYLSADFLLDGDTLAVFQIQLQEGADGPVMDFRFGLLNHCQARLRMPLDSVNQNRWMYPREGALLKPTVGGKRVDLQKVDRLRFVVLRTGGRTASWWMTPLRALENTPEPLAEPLLTSGALLDALGQSTNRRWPGRMENEAQLLQHLTAQRSAAPQCPWPEGFSRWGGWSAQQWEATGFFRTVFYDERWWLVDPDGHPFWSTGLDCVAPVIDTAITGIEAALEWLPPQDGAFAEAFHGNSLGQQGFDYLVANLIRAFGATWRENWAAIAHGLMRQWGFNTVANWSDWRAASRAGFPYVRPLHDDFAASKLIYRTFPDVFDPAFEADAQIYAAQLAETAADPALIGYFLMNEPTWGFSDELLAEGMLYNTPSCATRVAFAEYLREQYHSDAALSAAWGVPTAFDQVADGVWTTRLEEGARADLEAFSTRMVERFFRVLSAACKRVDPNHLNLGARYYTAPPNWVAKGMVGFDVFSMNCYRQNVPLEALKTIHETLGLPVLIGEWHFGALDVGLPGSGIGHVRDQEARGKAYRVYVENAAALPWCVGVHYFTLYDQSALGRFDGENYNIGFMDVCHQPYAPLVEAAQHTHQRLYHLVAGRLAPYADRPEYLPMLFL